MLTSSGNPLISIHARTTDGHRWTQIRTVHNRALLHREPVCRPAANSKWKQVRSPVLRICVHLCPFVVVTGYRSSSQMEAWLGGALPQLLNSWLIRNERRHEIQVGRFHSGHRRNGRPHRLDRPHFLAVQRRVAGETHDGAVAKLSDCRASPAKHLGTQLSSSLLRVWKRAQAFVS